MEKSRSLSQTTRITRRQAGAAVAGQADVNATLHQQLVEDDAHYRAMQLGLGEYGRHEGWIKAEEVEAASRLPVNDEVRHNMIAVAAFYLAEKRGFEGNDSVGDWMKAEVEIDRMLHGRP